jgi:hypothetical protein
MILYVFSLFSCLTFLPIEALLVKSPGMTLYGRPLEVMVMLVDEPNPFSYFEGIDCFLASEGFEYPLPLSLTFSLPIFLRFGWSSSILGRVGL